ncbi:MAG: TIGR02679 family protein [Bacillota bacterium]
MDNTELQDVARFFQKEPGFKRLFHKFIQNYQSLGRLGGTAKLTKLTKEEKEALGGFMGQDFSKLSSVTISVKDFIKALEKTRFSGVDLLELLFMYSNEKILTKSEEEEAYLRTKEQFFQKLLDKYPDTQCQQWLRYILDKKNGSKGIHVAYNENPLLLKEQLINILEAIGKLPTRSNNIPSRYWRLPLFANLVVGDPHAFDINTQQGRFLVFALGFIRTLEDKHYQLVSNFNSEEITELLNYFGIVRDDILNFVTLTGIIASEEVNHEPLKWWQTCWEEGVVINAPLKEILKAKSFFPANGQRAVFVVENSGVFSEIIAKLSGEKLPPLICTNGQFKLAALLLLDKLIKNDVIVYYSGDFDPEGLLMAQRLITRYPDNVRLWHYTEEDYDKAQSENILSENRLNKLRSLNLRELNEIKNLIKKTKKAGYQEMLLDKLIQDISKLCFFEKHRYINNE